MHSSGYWEGRWTETPTNCLLRQHRMKQMNDKLTIRFFFYHYNYNMKKVRHFQVLQTLSSLKGNDITHVASDCKVVIDTPSSPVTSSTCFQQDAQLVQLFFCFFLTVFMWLLKMLYLKHFASLWTALIVPVCQNDSWPSYFLRMFSGCILWCSPSLTVRITYHALMFLSLLRFDDKGTNKACSLAAIFYSMILQKPL